MRISHTVVGSPLGRLLLAATGRGVCAVALGTSAAGLQRALRRAFPSADIRRDDAGLRPWAQRLLDHVGGRRADLDLPLDVTATAFQSRVWDAVRAIPFGQTRSYKQIATAIGRPRAVRAVARACAANPAAVVIPCHRVVREDGRIGGYRWGARRKRALLAYERRRSGDR